MAEVVLRCARRPKGGTLDYIEHGTRFLGVRYLGARYLGARYLGARSRAGRTVCWGGLVPVGSVSWPCRISFSCRIFSSAWGILGPATLDSSPCQLCRSGAPTQSERRWKHTRALNSCTRDCKEVGMDMRVPPTGNYCTSPSQQEPTDWAQCLRKTPSNTLCSSHFKTHTHTFGGPTSLPSSPGGGGTLCLWVGIMLTPGGRGPRGSIPTHTHVG